MNIIEYILYRLKDIDSMYYEVICYIIILTLIVGI